VLGLPLLQAMNPGRSALSTRNKQVERRKSLRPRHPLRELRPREKATTQRPRSYSHRAHYEEDSSEGQIAASEEEAAKKHEEDADERTKGRHGSQRDCLGGVRLVESGAPLSLDLPQRSIPEGAIPDGCDKPGYQGQAKVLCRQQKKRYRRRDGG
jgi:hypothetical protein